MSAALGWAVLIATLAFPCALLVEMSTFLVRRARPGFRLRLPSRAALVGLGTFGLWYFIPLAIHAMLGRAAH